MTNVIDLKVILHHVLMLSQNLVENDTGRNGYIQ
jgi:hypothetical protein